MLCPTIRICLLALTLTVCTPVSTRAQAAEVVLDPVNPGDLSQWERVDIPSLNPALVTEEIASPLDGSTALRLSVTGNTLSSCESKGLRRTFITGTTSSSNAALSVYLAFAFDGTYYNLPRIQVELANAAGQILATHVWYGKDIIGGYYEINFSQSPGIATELSSASGQFVLNLSDFGSDVVFERLNVFLANYACVGTNSLVFDDLRLMGLDDADADSVPDLVDNCPGTPNPDQLDADADHLGDACDPFPNEADHEKAQCFADLASATSDSDGDGVLDSGDACSATQPATPVDLGGCSEAQFCSAIDAVSANGKRNCRRADWTNDEPLMKSREADCRVLRGGPNAADDVCGGAGQ